MHKKELAREVIKATPLVLMAEYFMLPAACDKVFATFALSARAKSLYIFTCECGASVVIIWLRCKNVKH